MEEDIINSIVKSVRERGYDYSDHPNTGIRANAIKCLEEATELVLSVLPQQDDLYDPLVRFKRLLSARFDLEVARYRSGVVIDGTRDTTITMSEAGDVIVTLANLWYYINAISAGTPTPLEFALIKSRTDKKRGVRKEREKS